MYQQPYPPQPGPYQQHAATKRKPRWWIIAIIIAAVVALVAGGLFAAYQFVGGKDVSLPSAEEAYASVPRDQYELRDPIAVDTYYEFRLTLKNPAKVQGDKLEGAEVAVDDIAKVYQDASLSVPVPVSVFAGMPIGDKEGSGTVDVGGLMDIPKYMQHGDEIGAEHGFLPSDGYYCVQYMGEDGKKLAKPIVQFFMVKDPTNSAQLAAVRGVKPTINATGGVDLSWQAVEGATSYNVYTYITQAPNGAPDTDDYREGYSTITKIGSSTKTTLLSDDYDKPDHEKKKTGLDDVDNAVLDQNYAFQDLARYTQDQLDSCKNDTSEYCADIMKETGGTWSPSLAGKLYFVVMAVDENKHEGRWRATDANDIVPSIPVGVAQQAQINQWAYGLKGVFGEDNTIEEDMQAYVYTFVQMADGATVPVPSKFSDLQPTGQPNSWHFTYSAPGTKISDSANLWYEGDLTAEFPRITQAAIQALPKAGGLLDRLNAVDNNVDWSGYDTKKIDSDNSKSPYFIFASTDYGTYLANNILNGHQVIDITKYSTDWNLDSDDVMEELTYQNPYVCVDSGCVDYTVRKQGGKTVMWVKYPDDYQARQKQLADFVDAAKPSITSGSDRDKAIAIDQFLAAHMSYDYDAFAAVDYGSGNAFDNTGAIASYPDAWSPLGMVNGKGVCLAYAYGYQALAKAAGLDTRVVTGSVSSSKSSHAWNYVSVDGQWLLMDATWDDDGGTASDRYQLKDPSQVGDHYAFSHGWMLSSQLRQH